MNPGLRRTWGGDVVKGSMDLGTGIDCGWLELLAHLGLHRPVCTSALMVPRHVMF